MLKNEKGFTLIEMMIVLLVISVLLFITIPNVTNQSNSINSKGCEAFVHMVEGQVEAYKMDGNLNENYKACPDGSAITIDAEGKVTSN